MQLISFFSKFFDHFRVNRSSRDSEFFHFKGQISDSGLISETKIPFEPIFETNIFKGKKFCLRFKSFNSFSNKYIFV